MIRIERYESVEALSGLVPDWRTLAASVGSYPFFARPEWHLAWWQGFAERVEMRVVAAWDQNRMVGLMPLCIARGGKRDGFARRLEFATREQSDQHTVLVDPAYAGEVTPIFDSELRAISASVDVVHLAHLSQHEPLRAYETMRGAFAFAESHPVLSLEGSFESITKTWRSGHRRDAARQQRRLESLGELKLKVFDSADNIPELLAEFMAMHRRKWSAAGDTRSLRHPAAARFEGFYREVWKYLGPSGAVHFSALLLDGTPISFHFGFLHQRRFYYYKPAYEPSYENLSPSKVHQAFLLREAYDRGCREFDFLLGCEPYKYQWGAKDREVSSFTFAGRRSVLSKPRTWWVGSGMNTARTLNTYARTAIGRMFS